MQTEIPFGWQTVPLGSVVKRVRRTAEGVPETIAMITSTGGFVPQSDKYSRFMAGESLQNYVALRRGEFAYNKGNSKTYPQGCIYRQDQWSEAAIPSVYISFRITDARLDSDFAAQFFAGGGLNQQLKRVITSGARSNGLLNVSGDDFFACDIPLPPVAEQKKIAALLASVDDAIKATRAVMEQARRVKDGLLQDLLTRGIGHTRFKQTEVGEIPESWEVRELADTVSFCTYGFTNPMPTTSEGPWIVTARDIIDGGINYDTARKTSQEAFDSDLTDKSKPIVGDVLVTKDGTLGRVAPVDKPGICITQSVAVLRPKSFSTAFLTSLLHSPPWQERMLADAGGSTIKHIYISKLAKMPVVVPPAAEREAIVNGVSAAERALRSEIEQFLKLGRVKAGLLEDLLTGAVRVSA